MKAKKLFSILLAVVMLLSLSVSAFADNSDGESYTRGSITIKNPQEGETYKAYKIFDVTYNLGGEGTAHDKYAYTIATEWVNDVVAYATPVDGDGNPVDLADGWTSTTANGLTVTKVLDTAKNVTAYNVTFDSSFSAPDFGEKMATKTGDKNDYETFETKDGKLIADGLDLGYYMVQPTTANSLVSLTTTDKDVEISDKNEKPEVDKQLVGEDDILVCGKEIHEHTADCYEGGVLGEGTLKCGKEEHKAHTEDCYKEKDYTTKSVGDKVDFQLGTKVPDMTGYDPYFFVMNDTMTAGLTFNNDVNITIGGKDKTKTPLTAGTDYTVKVTENEDGTTNIRIVFNNMKTKYLSDVEANDWEGEPIVITYSATVNEDAVMGTEGNTNTAKIEYSNNPNIVPEWDPEDPEDPENPGDKNDPQDPGYKHNQDVPGVKNPTGTSVEDKVTVYTAELDITKVDANGGAALTGAKFKIEGEKLNVSIVNKTIFEEDENGTWYRLKDGTYTEESPDKDGKNQTTYAEKGDGFVPVTFEELTGEQAVANVGLYYSTDDGDTMTWITAENHENVPDGAKIYKPTYNTVGLYVNTAEEGTTENWVKVTEDNAAELYNTTPAYKYYEATVWKQSDLYEDTTKTYKKVEVIDKTNASETFEAEGWVDENGLITFAGLGEGTYYITELVAPDGYNLLKNPIEVVVELVKDGDGYKFQITVDGADTPVSEDNKGVLPFNVENNQGIELPETGGIGTKIFYVLGSLFVIAAGVMYIVKKRMSAEF